MTGTTALLPGDDLARLRAALSAADFTATGVAARIGPEAAAAVNRGDHRAALRATAGGTPLDTLVRLYVCGQAVPADAAGAAVPVAPLLAGGLLVADGGAVRAGVDLEPYGDGCWVVADLPAAARPRGAGTALPADHVLGVGGASRMLGAATVRHPVASALDLGTGCGIQALDLARHAARVTATDVSARALRFAATTAALSGQSWELLPGDLARPVAGRRFDLVVSNPPFVVGPGAGTHAYRDSGRAGDAVCAQLAAAAPGLLTEGGTMQFLANWAHVRGEDWADRVAGWVEGAGLDAWVVQREVSDPLSYARLWLADAGQEHDPHLLAAWLDWYDAHRIEAVGFGLVNLRRTDAAPVVRVEDLRQPVEGRWGDHVAAWWARQDWLRGRDAEGLLRTRYRTAPELRLEQSAARGADGWAVDRQLLALHGGLGRREEVDPVLVALVGGCDGTATVADQLAVLAAAYDVPAAALAGVAGPVLARLVERGVLVPVEGDVVGAA
ncbi:SAM-dependent methyltransferase [Pilimelia terevasa]|uniref:SAM-dependent methyltransferase n=1 Tax=Pilimelia terevasa TaxID=53372 RepID=A0A8J3BKB2_9ACTN|nr:methyltransferase [Pilimelia terevasa]GGK27237.1 SAM-dependent methyltransferase [Pilimelia terevasa]